MDDKSGGVKFDDAAFIVKPLENRFRIGENIFVQDGAKDAGGLTPVKDNNPARRKTDRKDFSVLSSVGLSLSMPIYPM